MEFVIDFPIICGLRADPSKGLLSQESGRRLHNLGKLPNKESDMVGHTDPVSLQALIS